jgi:hypothetical protein
MAHTSKRFRIGECIYQRITKALLLKCGSTSKFPATYVRTKRAQLFTAKHMHKLPVAGMAARKD